MSDLTSVPKTIRHLLILSSALLLASLVISGLNAYATFAAPSQSPYVPSAVGFEGRLADTTGQPVADGTYTITFSLYSEATGGTALWSETQNVTVSGGLYSVQLGSITPLNPTHFEGSRWLGVQVSGDSEMAPRIAISAVPFALNARQAMGLQGYDVAASAPQNGDALVWNAAQNQWQPNAAQSVADHSIVEGRLTLESGVPISTTDQVAQTTLYFTAYSGNRIALYDGTAWNLYTFSQVSMPIPATAGNTNFDIFIYVNSGSLALEAVAWATNTIRATQLAVQDGVYVKSGAPTYRYLGTIRTTAVGQSEDSRAKRFVWNYYNRVQRLLYRNDPTPSWGLTGTWRSMNNDPANQVEFVVGFSTEPVSFTHHSTAYSSSGVQAYTGIGLDWTSGQPGIQSWCAYGIYCTLIVHYYDYPGIGYHYLRLLDYGSTSVLYGGAYQRASGSIWG